MRKQKKDRIQDLRTFVISVNFSGQHDGNYKEYEFLKLAKSLSVLSIKKSTALRLLKSDPAFFLSKGHLNNTKTFVAENNIGLVLIDNPLTPIQQRNLEKKLDAKVLDRTGLVLEIFGSRAQTKEGMLQVELAHLLHQKSRLVRSWTHLERQRGGKGFLGGPGETQIESDRRSLASKIVGVKNAINKVKKTRGVQRNLRLKNNIPLISFVGYTNAGKSTLFNAFPNKKTKSENRLFSTLDPYLKKCGSPNKEYIISDTVGFIRNLPTSLVIAFRATLEEISYSDLIVHVVDISDENADEKADVVYKTLETLGVEIRNSNKIVEVHNKVDISFRKRSTPFLKGLPKNKVYSISAANKQGLNPFFRGIEQNLYKKLIKENIILDVYETEKIKWLYQNQLVKSSELRNSDIKLELIWHYEERQRFNEIFVGTVL